MTAKVFVDSNVLILCLQRGWGTEARARNPFASDAVGHAHPPVEHPGVAGILREYHA